MKNKRQCSYIIWSSLLLSLVSFTSGFAATELLQNPGFDVSSPTNNLPPGWTGQIHVKEGARGSFATDGSVFHSAPFALCIKHTSTNSAWVRMSQDDILAQPASLYLCSTWVKAQAPYMLVLYEFTSPSDYITHTLAAGSNTPGWRQFSGTVTTSAKAKRFRLSLVVAGQGTVWFDDVSLRRVGEKPHATAQWTDTAPVIDGRLDEAQWQQTQGVDDFTLLDGKGVFASARTQVRMLQDRDTLYLGFHCEEPNIAEMKRLQTTNNPQVWGDDCVEVFLDVEGDGVGWLHLGVSAGGGRWQEKTLGQKLYSNWYTWFSADDRPINWDAKVTVGEQAWEVEIRLPFSELKGRPDKGKFWGLQLCRTRQVPGAEENSTWSYIDGKQYARPERFGKLTLASIPAKNLQRLDADAHSRNAPPVIIPTPVSVQWQAGKLYLKEPICILIQDEAQRKTAQLLQSDLQDRFNLKADIQTSLPYGAICINLVAFPVEGVSPPPKDYQVTVFPGGIALYASMETGRLHGVQTLRQMLQVDDAGVFIRCGKIIDEPQQSWRGWHIAAPRSAEDLPYYYELIDTLSVLKYNTLVIEINQYFQYESHPQVNAAGAISKDQMRELVEYAKGLQFEVIPQLATLSHFNYVLTKPEFKELAEQPENGQGRRGLFNYCPSNPKTHKLVEDLMSEIIEVFEPKYFHIGHDEASFDAMGVCPLCTGKTPVELFAGDINRLHDWLAQRNIKTIIWGDQLLENHTGGAPYFTAQATDLLPRDIIIFDWHYEPNWKYDNSLGYFRGHGFEVVGCPWYEPVNVQAYAQATVRNGCLGVCGTTWMDVRPALENTPHLPAAWVLGSEFGWGVNRQELDSLGWQPVPEFNRLRELAKLVVTNQFYAVDLAPYCNRTLADNTQKDGWLGLGLEQDLGSVPAGRLQAGDFPFNISTNETGQAACVMLSGKDTSDGQLPESVTGIRINSPVRELYFLHTCSVPRGRNRQLYATENPDIIGEYVVKYADGSQKIIPLKYLANIHDWNGQRGPAKAVGIWEGQTKGGALISLGAVRWVNPRPEIEVTTIDFKSTLLTVKPVLLGLTVGR